MDSRVKSYPRSLAFKSSSHVYHANSKSLGEGTGSWIFTPHAKLVIPDILCTDTVPRQVKRLHVSHILTESSVFITFLQHHIKVKDNVVCQQMLCWYLMTYGAQMCHLIAKICLRVCMNKVPLSVSQFANKWRTKMKLCWTAVSITKSNTHRNQYLKRNYILQQEMNR